MGKQQFGIIGLGTMGRNLLLNASEKGFSCSGFDVDPEKRRLLADAGGDILAAENLPAFLDSLDRPRKIALLVPAGPAVDGVIRELTPMLEPGDLVIDAGNSHFDDTDRRETELRARNIRYLGVGISGGEEGARRGPSVMAGGDPESYGMVRELFESVAAKVDGKPCAAHVGKGSAGHFVKMVHNGIEYAMMQLIAEAYDLLKRGYELDYDAMAELFDVWNAAELQSFLVEVTARVLKRPDERTGGKLVEKILDTAGQKGTGKWTSKAALDLGVPVPTIDAAVAMRQISAMRPERLSAAGSLQIAMPLRVDEELRRDTVEFIRSGLFLGFLTAYAQGFALLRAASEERTYGLDLAEIAGVWRGGCIIRSAMLDGIREAFTADPGLPNLLLAPNFREPIRLKQSMLKGFVHFAVSADIPCMAAAASLNYLKAYATERLPANLIQAQRDHFGAHTYQRLDREGTFHTPDW